MRPEGVDSWNDSYIIPELEECLVARASNEVVRYSYEIPGVGHVYVNSARVSWTDQGLRFKDKRGSRCIGICLGSLWNKLAPKLQGEMRNTFSKMVEKI